ncbi:hypothetical protein Tco_0831483 [Tanacetum coccineum]
MQTQMGQLEEAFQERQLGMLPSDTETYPREERKVVTTISGLTLDGSFIPHSNFPIYQYEKLEPETIIEVVEIPSSKSTPLVPPLKTPPLSAPKPKEDLEPNPHQPPIPCLFQLQEEKFHALENLTGRADHFVYRIDIIDSLGDKFPIENNSLSGNPTPSSDFYETFSFDIEEKSSGSTTSYSDYSLTDYDAFYFDDDHIEENSSSSTTTHSDFSLPKYDLFIFDLSIDPFPPADRSDLYHEEFVDEFAHIISPPDIELNDFPLLLSDCDSSLSKEFSEIDLLVSFPSGNEDIVFDPGIFIIKGVQSERFHILPLDNFPTISFVSDSLLLTDSSEIETFLSFPSRNEDKGNQGPKLIDQELVIDGGLRLKIEERLGLEASPHSYKRRHPHTRAGSSSVEFSFSLFSSFNSLL